METAFDLLAAQPFLAGLTDHQVDKLSLWARRSLDLRRFVAARLDLDDHRLTHGTAVTGAQAGGMVLLVCGAALAGAASAVRARPRPAGP
jgi:hypothetical protein